MGHQAAQVIMTMHNYNCPDKATVVIGMLCDPSLQFPTKAAAQALLPRVRLGQHLENLVPTCPPSFPTRHLTFSTCHHVLQQNAMAVLFPFLSFVTHLASVCCERRQPAESSSMQMFDNSGHYLVACA